MHSVIRRSPSTTSSTVADPSTVTVRIESASTCDLNVQDVSTSSSSSNEDDDDNVDLKQRRRKQTLTDHFNYRTSSAASRRHTTTMGVNHQKKSFHQKRPSRLNTDVNSIQVPQSRPTTANSLPAKPSAYDNEWDFEPDPPPSTSPSTTATIAPRRNPSCPSISPTTVRSKTSSSPSPVVQTFTPQQAPPVFTTTSECLGTDYRPQLRRDIIPRRSQSLIKQNLPLSTPASPTVPIVFLTDDILLGSIRALQNERQLCKLSVDYLIDASNMRPDELARKANVGAPLPCQCGHTHSRCTLTLEFDQPYLSSTTTTTGTTQTNSTDTNHLSSSKIRELSRTQLGQLFSAVNRFISKAQQEEKRVLIYGFELTPNSPLAVIAIQYLMSTDEQMTLTEAIHSVHRLFPILPIKHQQFPTMDKRFQDYLKQLDRKTTAGKNFLTSNISGDGTSTSSGNEHQRASELFDLTLNNNNNTNSNSNKSKTTSLTSWTTIPMPIVNENSNRFFRTRSAWDS